MVTTRSKRKAGEDVVAVEEVFAVHEGRRLNKSKSNFSVMKKAKKMENRGHCTVSPSKKRRRARSGRDLTGSPPPPRRRKIRVPISKAPCENRVFRKLLFRNLKARGLPRRWKSGGVDVETRNWEATQSEGESESRDCTSGERTSHTSSSSPQTSDQLTSLYLGHTSSEVSGSSPTASSAGVVPDSASLPTTSDEYNCDQREPPERAEEESTDEPSLPKRLFATDRYPTNGRVNSYSKMQYIPDILKILDGLPDQYQTLMNSCFRCLFKLPVRRCLLSGKLVHNFICRQILSTNSHELWFTFGGYPIRFSLREFELVTGLPCGPYPDHDDFVKLRPTTEDRSPYWKELFGSDDDVTVKDIVEMLQSDPTMDPMRKLRLVLVVIVDGILICGTQPIRPSVQVVEMVRHLDSFLAYPWGRLSFERTLRMVKVGDKINVLSDLTTKLRQASVALHGFPISIQLLLFRSVPLLLRHLPYSDDEQTFLDRQLTTLPLLKSYRTDNIIQLENDPQLRVHFILPIITDELRQRVPVDFDSDPKICHLLRLIEGGFSFDKLQWRGGYALLPLLCICKKRKNLRCKCGARLDAQSTARVASDVTPGGRADPSDQIAKLTKEVQHLKKDNAAEIKKLKSVLITEMNSLLRAHQPMPHASPYTLTFNFPNLY